MEGVARIRRVKAHPSGTWAHELVVRPRRQPVSVAIDAGNQVCGGAAARFSISRFLDFSMLRDAANYTRWCCSMLRQSCNHNGRLQAEKKTRASGWHMSPAASSAARALTVHARQLTDYSDRTALCRLKIRIPPSPHKGRSDAPSRPPRGPSCGACLAGDFPSSSLAARLQRLFRALSLEELGTVSVTLEPFRRSKIAGVLEHRPGPHGKAGLLRCHSLFCSCHGVSVL